MNTPQINETWILKIKKEDPFLAKSVPEIKILEIKSGWVRYYQNSSFPDERLKIEIFTEVWEKKA